MENIKNVTNASVQSVCDWLEGIENAFEAFDKWIEQQSFNFNERTVAKTIFNFKFASGPISAWTQGQLASKAIGVERSREIRDMVKKFVVDNNFATESEFDEDEE